MTPNARNEILSKFALLRYCVLWPDENWDDIGFTERPIWINSSGFGYYLCDEPCAFVEIGHISDTQINNLKNKIECNQLSFDEFIKTPLNAIVSSGFLNNDDYDVSAFTAFLDLPDHIVGSVFCGETVEGWRFFSSEIEMINEFDKGDAFNGGEYWSDLGDEQLLVWHSRIFEEQPDLILPLTQNYCLKKQEVIKELSPK